MIKKNLCVQVHFNEFLLIECVKLHGQANLLGP